MAPQVSCGIMKGKPGMEWINMLKLKQQKLWVLMPTVCRQTYERIFNHFWRIQWGYGGEAPASLSLPHIGQLSPCDRCP